MPRTTGLRAMACAPAAALALLAACAMPGPAAQTVQFDGTAYRVEQLTASTWAVVSPATLADTGKTATLVKVIEKASNCKVTDSSYSPQGKALNAQVDCGSRLKN